MISALPPEAVNAARKNVADILAFAFEHSDSSRRAMVIFDLDCPLSAVLTEAYRAALPGAEFISFTQTAPEVILAGFEKLTPLDLVVLVQSTNFRLNAFRIRVELFNRGLKVIEHPHLSRMSGPEILYYIDSLAYDSAYYRGTGKSLKALIDRAQSGTVETGGEKLVFASGFESAKLNVGDYTGMKNIGGQFPIGEVFTESRDLEAVNGRLRIFAFGDISFKVNRPEKPITLTIAKGRVTDAAGSTPDFDRVLAAIRADEGDVLVRELGFGLNRAFTRERVVSDIGTYERMCGVHLSLGAKHTIYKKSGLDFTHKTARHHIDIFAAAESVMLDGAEVYRGGTWRV